MKLSWEMKVSTQLKLNIRVAEIIFATIFKLTEFFEAMYEINEGRHQKKVRDFSFISGINVELRQICGLTKKVNSTPANMGQSQSPLPLNTSKNSSIQYGDQYGDSMDHTPPAKLI